MTSGLLIAILINALTLAVIAGTLYWFMRSFHLGYWDEHSEDPARRMIDDDGELH